MPQAEPQAHRGTEPAYVAFGGGSGLNALLSGLKAGTDRITAVVTVTDDGGSSGRIRKDFDILPPGDIRNCLVALASSKSLMADLFSYRFEESDLKGHNFGNLLITALTKITGSFLVAIETANKILSVRGRVLPSTLRKVSLVAHHADGSKSTGEVAIVKSGKPVERIELRPDPGPVREDIAAAVEEADVLIFGPGSLYTSLIPNVLLGGFAECVRASRAARVFVCNIMTQPGETDGYSAADHVRKFLEHADGIELSHVVVNSGRIPEDALAKYRVEGAQPVVNDLGGSSDWNVVEADLVSVQGQIRHNPDVLAKVIETIYREHKLSPCRP